MSLRLRCLVDKKILAAGCRLMFRYQSAHRSFKCERSARRGDRRPGNQYSVVDDLSFGCCLATVFAVETLDTSGCIYQLLLAREERVAVRANFKSNLRFCRARRPRLAARAVHSRVHVLR